jgi:flagellar hook assembly protein FlgD
MRKTGTSKFFFIYDLKGGKVREMTAPGTGGTWTWDGTDDKGKPCAQGTYLYVLVVDDESICDGTITILR